MKVRINGKEENVEMINNLYELVARKNLDAHRIVIEHNMRIVPQEEWPRSSLSEDDNIEIVSFVGGG